MINRYGRGDKDVQMATKALNSTEGKRRDSNIAMSSKKVRTVEIEGEINI